MRNRRHPDPRYEIEQGRTPGRVPRLTFATVALTGVAIAFGACGSSSDPTAMLNTARVENAIARSSLEQRGQRAEVSCPSEVKQEVGLGFSCVASVGQVETKFVVTQTDSAGNVRYEAP
jgi:hypothetical protein